MLFSILVDCQKRGVRSVADHAILRPGCLQENGRLQPEFAVSVRRPDMDMGRLTSLVGLEVKTERSDAQNCRHELIIPHAKLHRNIFCQRPQAQRQPHLFAAAHVHIMFFQGGLPLHTGGSKEIPPSRLSLHSSLDPSRKSRMCMPTRHPFQAGYFLANIKGEPRAAAHWLQHLVRRIPF